MDGTCMVVLPCTTSFRGASRRANYDVQMHIRESIITIAGMDSGSAPRGASLMCNCTSENDDRVCTTLPLSRPHPIAMKTIGNAMAKMHQRDGAGLDISGIEYRKIAAVFPRAPDRGEQPAVAFRGVGAAFDKDSFRNGVAGGQQVVAEPLAVAVDMHDAGQRAEHRQIRVGAGVPAVVRGET